MAEKRDLLDEFIDIKNDWQSLSNPVEDITNALAANPEEVETWNPSDYKDRPRANVNSCIACQGKSMKLCHACADVCPVKAIDFSEGSIEVLDSCRKCGLCVTACPAGSFTSPQINPRRLYERIVRAASAYEHAYVTCTRAIGRMPQENEVVLPCIGDVPAEVWFAILADYKNVSVYLPLGICDRCRNTTGEEMLGSQIELAEQLSGKGIGLEVDEKDLDYTKNHDFERKEFLESMSKQGMAALGAANPALAAARTIKQKLDENTRRINAITHAVEGGAAPAPTQRRRVLTQRRQLVMTTLQRHPKLAVRLSPQRPTCDPERCNLCGDCVDVCPTRACELAENGIFKVESAYCIECGACLKACGEHALTWEKYEGAELVVPDKEEVERKKRQAEQKAEMEKLKKQGMAQLRRGLDILEKLDTDN